MGHFGPEMAHPHNSGSALRIVLKFCRMKGATRYMKILLIIFREKVHLGQFYPFNLLVIFYFLGMVKLSQATVNWILKQLGHDFFHNYY